MELEQPSEGGDEDDWPTLTSEEIEECCRLLEEEWQEQEEADALQRSFLDSMTNEELRDHYKSFDGSKG